MPIYRTNRRIQKNETSEYLPTEEQGGIDGVQTRGAAYTPRHATPKKRTLTIVVLTILVLWFLISFLSSTFAWKAVFLDSNQVFFGKFVNIPFVSTITLRKAHFIKPDEVDSASSTPTRQNMIISKIGEMPHGPAEDMVISKDHILYYENLKPGSSMVKGLEQSETRK